MKIVLIESDEEIRYRYQTALSFQKLEVISASSAKEGAQLVKTSGPLLVILDVMVPDFHEVDFDALFTKEAKKTPSLLVVDEIVNQGTLNEATRLGASGTLSKDQDSLGKMITMVREIVDKR